MQGHRHQLQLLLCRWSSTSCNHTGCVALLQQVEKVYLLVRSKRHLSARQRVENMLCSPLFNMLHDDARKVGIIMLAVLPKCERRSSRVRRQKTQHAAAGRQQLQLQQLPGLRLNRLTAALLSSAAGYPARSGAESGTPAWRCPRLPLPTVLFRSPHTQ